MAESPPFKITLSVNKILIVIVSLLKFPLFFPLIEMKSVRFDIYENTVLLTVNI